MDRQEEARGPQPELNSARLPLSGAGVPCGSGAQAIEKYLCRSDWEVEENSNITTSLQGLQFYVASQAARAYWLEKIYPLEAARAHIEGDLHLHDLQVLGCYCNGWDLLDLLMEGFRGVEGKTESLPPKHFSSALGQVVNFLYTLQGESAGAQALSNFDTLLAPFVRADGLSYQNIKQEMQEFVFNLNVPTRLGFQAPFTNITLDLTPPKVLADMPAVVGGVAQKETYGEFQEEMALINRAFAEVMAEGDGRERPFTFPIPTYSITSEFPWDAPWLVSLWEATAKYGTPYFANFINSDLSPEDVRSMCCRLRLDVKKLERRGGGYFGSHPLTGSVGVVTLNMARLGHLCRNREEFFARLGAWMDTAKDALEAKRKALEAWMENGLYPYSRFYLREVQRRFGEYFKNHFSTIGILGVHEGCLNFLGQGIETIDGRNLALQTLRFMKDKLLRFQEETQNLYNLEATPAEGASYRLAKLDRERYPQMPALGTVGEGGYTNSTQLPVGLTEDPFFALEHQDDLQTLYTGGTVLHFFLGERPENKEGLKSFVKKVAYGFHLPYFTITPTASICPKHGYLPGEQEFCWCGAKTEIYSRVVGYLRPTSSWNIGKKEEFKKRKPYRLPGQAS